MGAPRHSLYIYRYICMGAHIAKQRVSYHFFSLYQQLRNCLDIVTLTLVKFFSAVHKKSVVLYDLSSYINVN